MSKKKRTQNTFTPEIRDRAIRMVMEQQSKHSSQWAATNQYLRNLAAPHKHYLNRFSGVSSYRRIAREGTGKRWC